MGHMNRLSVPCFILRNRKRSPRMYNFCYNKKDTYICYKN